MRLLLSFGDTDAGFTVGLVLWSERVLVVKYSFNICL